MGTLKDKKLFVALPIYRQVDAYTVKSLLDLVVKQMAYSTFDMMMDTHVGECPIGRCRNDLTHTFLNSDCTHLLFIDSDIKFTYEQVERILAHDEDIVGGYYCIKQEGPVRLCCNTLNEVDKPNADSLVKMKYMGTGFIRISRKVFEAMIAKLGDSLEYIDDTDHKTVKHDFWRMGVADDPRTGKKRWLSEDWQFCQFALDLGFDIWADAAIMLEHVGTAIYPLQSQLPQLYSKEALERIRAQWQKDSAQAGGAAEAFSPEVDAAPVSIPAVMQDEVAEYDIRLKEPPKSILDIGACVGAFTLLAKSKWPDAKVEAYEPVPHSAEMAQSNCSRLSGVHVNHAAVRGFNGKADINIGECMVNCGFHNIGSFGEGTVEVNCVDAASLPKADLVKIDTEGCELEIINRLDLSETKALVCEYHLGDFEAIIEKVKGFGLNLLSHKVASANYGILKFAREGAIV